MKAFDVVILANGAFPTHVVPLKVLNEAERVVCCDGAVKAFPNADIVIGDGDSVPAEFRNRLIQVDEQEDNDLTKATHYCKAQGWHNIAYVGCTGKREDHTLGNISLLMRYYREMNINGTMFTDSGYFTPAQGEQTFDSMPGQQVSIFNFGCKTITSEGLRWNSYAYQELWQGTLNESLADHFTMRTDGFYMIFRTYSNKYV